MKLLRPEAARWTNRAGDRLRLVDWQPEPSTRAGRTVIFLHGLGGCAEDFDPAAQRLAGSGIRSVAWDLRGQGLDPDISRRGRFLDVGGHLDDLEDLVEATRGDRPERIFVCGESMGALLAIRAAASRRIENLVAGWILLAPVVGLAQQNPPWVKAVVNALGACMPGLRMRPSWFVHGKATTPKLTRDPEIQRQLENAPHRLGPVTLPFLSAMGDLIDSSVRVAPQVVAPVAVFSGGNDVFVSSGQTDLFYEALGSPNKNRFHYPESCHRILLDYDAPRAMADLAAWIESIASA